MESKRAHDHENWDPDWIQGSYYAILSCPRQECLERVISVGEMQVAPVVTESGSWYGEYDDHLLPKYFQPPLNIIDLPDKCPADIGAQIEDASRILFMDPDSAANRIRVAIETLLTANKVPRSATGKKGRYRLTTDARIKRFAEKKPEVADFLKAVKWIGNAGSHEKSLTTSDVLDGIELFHHAIDLLYNNRRQELARLATKINQNKGIKKSRPKKPPF
ncbi:DUF4145 domain-containing protein [Actinomadura miaoliensis]